MAPRLPLPTPATKGLQTWWFDAPQAPTASTLLLVDGRRRGPVLNAAVMSNAAPSYAPAGRHLVQVTCLLGPDGTGGMMKGSELAQSFASLRANDLIWNYVVNNYLKGQDPPAFDLLFWNGDSTNLPGPMYLYYIRNFYLDNKLTEHGGINMLGEDVDLALVDVPTFVYCSREDHIVPWKSAFASAELWGGDVEFVMGASGHIAGVINPPGPKKRSYWTGNFPAPTPEAWDSKAKEHPGSWWPHWYTWLAPHSGKRVAAPKQPKSKLGAAPGTYVLAKA